MSPPVDQVMAGRVVLVTAEPRRPSSGQPSAVVAPRSGTRRRSACSRTLTTLLCSPRPATRDLIADPPDVVVITTGIGLRGWIEAADAVGLGEQLTQALAGARIVARGPKARGAIQAAGLQADWVAESETSAEIAEVLLDEGVRGVTVAVARLRDVAGRRRRDQVPC